MTARPLSDSADIADLSGTLPHAPLAMPKQRLEPAMPTARALLAALLRPLIARVGRSRG